MTTQQKLTIEQDSILRDMTNKRRYEDGWATAQWISESHGRFYNCSWVSSRIQGLIKRGYVERGVRGYYRITDAGRTALATKESPLVTA